jgi:hypothetical protein
MFSQTWWMSSEITSLFSKKHYMSMCCSVITLTLQFPTINFWIIILSQICRLRWPASEAAMVLSDDAKESLIERSYRPPARRDRVQVGVHVTEDVRDALKQLSLHERMPVQVLLCQAINDLFEKHGIERLAMKLSCRAVGPRKSVSAALGRFRLAVAYRRRGKG